MPISLCYATILCQQSLTKHSFCTARVYIDILSIISCSDDLYLYRTTCRVIILLWRPFHKCLARLKKSINPRSSVIRAFTTFMTLSFSKTLSLTFIAFSPIPYYERENSWYYLSLVNPDYYKNKSQQNTVFEQTIFYILFHSTLNSVNTDILAYCSSPALPHLNVSVSFFLIVVLRSIMLSMCS